MITRLTKIQLVIFAIVTLLGGAFVGGRYAQIDRLVVDRTYPVMADFADSGGIFSGAEVTYRGVAVGRVGKLTFAGDTVEVTLNIENDAPKIPADVEALVANKSAVGEQYVDLRPQSTGEPYLNGQSVIATENTQIPISATELLVNQNKLVKSVDLESLQTLVNETGAAFEGTGNDLTTIVDTSMEFIETATANLDVTRALIRDSGSVLQTQIDKQDQFKSFSRDFALLSDTLVASDADLERLIDEGPSSAALVRKVVAENTDDLTVLFNNFVTANAPIFENIDGIRSLFILYPYIVNGAGSVLEQVEGGPAGTFNARFGDVSQSKEPENCEEGYESDQRDPSDLSPKDFRTEVDCTNDELNPRGANKVEIPERNNSVANRAPAASYDWAVNTFGIDADGNESNVFTGSLAAGKDSWKWLLLGPAASK